MAGEKAVGWLRNVSKDCGCSKMSYYATIYNTVIADRSFIPVKFFFFNSCEANACGGFIRNCFSLRSNVLTG